MIIVIILALFAADVKASNTIINNNNVEIPISKYEYLTTFYQKEKINNLTQEEYNYLKDKELTSILKEEHYYVTTTHKDEKGNTILSTTTEITKDMYEQESMVATISVCDEGDVCWETDYKRIAMDFVCYEAVSLTSDRCGFAMYVHWNRLPSVRSYDILAFRWSSNFVMETYKGQQDGHVNGIIQHTDYLQGGTNSKSSATGVGISMNLYDDADTLYLAADVDGILTDLDAISIYATYQHATSALTLANSKSYTFSSSGLGEVLYFSNTTIRNKYDNMQGIKLENYGEM